MKITLPNFSWKTLNDLITGIPWATTPKEFLIAGRIDVDGKIKLPDAPTPLTPEWKNQETTLEFSKPEVEVCAKCLQVLAPKGILFVNKYSHALFKAFEIKA